jgi:prefoldin subunit 5
MKKGLLGLLVAALTLVGCQNYDDQFDELNTKIAGLAKSVGELDSIRTTIGTLSTDLATLASTSASAADLTKVLTEVSGLKDALDAIKEDAQYTEEQVADLDEEVDEILTALNELLEQSAVIQQDIVITSMAQLEYVESLMALDATADNTFVADETREYIVSGNITVDAEFVTEAAIATRLNNVVARIASVITPEGGTGVTIDSGSAATKGTALTMTSIAFVQGSVSLEGANAISVPKLAALTATLTLKQGGAIAFPTLNQVGNVRIAATSTVTSIDFSTVSTGGMITTGTDELSDPALTGAVNLGKLDLPATVSLAKATSISAGGAPNGVTISAPLANSVDLVDTTTFAVTGNVSITAKGHITLNAKSITGSLTIKSTTGNIALNDLKSAGIISLTASGTIHAGITANASGTVASGSEVHLAALASNAGGLTITAAAIDLGKLKTNTNTATINTAKTVALPELTHTASNVVAPAATTFVAGKLATASGTIDTAAKAAITVANLTATTTLVDFANMLTLTVLAQSDNIDLAAASSMTTLNYTGKKIYKDKMDQQTNSVSITTDALTALNIGDGYIGTLNIVSAGGLKAITTAGKIVNTVIQNNNALETISFGHDHLAGERAAVVNVSNNNKILALDLSTINKVKHVNITNNSSMTALTMAGYSPAAEPGAQVTVTISGNALAATYTTAVAGSETTPYSDASLTDATGLLCSVSDFVNFYADQTDRSATNTPTVSINLTKVTNDAASPLTRTLSVTLSGDDAAKAGIDGVAGGAGAADDETDGGAIDSIAELNAIIDTCS